VIRSLWASIIRRVWSPVKLWINICIYIGASPWGGFSFYFWGARFFGACPSGVFSASFVPTFSLVAHTIFLVPPQGGGFSLSWLYTRGCSLRSFSPGREILYPRRWSCTQKNVVSSEDPRCLPGG